MALTGHIKAMKIRPPFERVFDFRLFPHELLDYGKLSIFKIM
jgi:hypothetical protein